MIEPEYREFLLDLADSDILPRVVNDQGDYWARCFRRRNGKDAAGNLDPDWEGSEGWTEIAPFTDMIKMQIVEKPSQESAGKIQHISIVPCSPFFYDFLLSYYLLSNPDFYQTPAKLVTMLMGTMEKLRIDPSGMANFPAGVWRWLTHVRDGEKSFSFLENPIELLWNLQWIQYMVNKYGEEQVFEKGFTEREAVRRDEKLIQEDVEKRFRLVLARHPTLHSVVELATDGETDHGEPAEQR